VAEIAIYDDSCRNAYDNIAPNVGLINANHDPWNLDRHVDGAPIALGYHWYIVMSAAILPGVELGERTMLGARDRDDQELSRMPLHHCRKPRPNFVPFWKN